MENVTLFILVAILIGCLIVISAFIKWRKKRALKVSDIQFIKQRWDDIVQAAPANYSFAIMEADKLLDFVLKKRSAQETFVTRLKAVEPLLDDTTSIWLAHRLRNTIAHEANEEIPQERLKSALHIYKKTLCNLGIPL